MVTKDTKEFQSFLAGLKVKQDERIKKLSFTTGHLPDDFITYSFGKKYIRIVIDKAAYAFIDTTNGDVLKPAGWSSPAKHARGNIFADDNGLDCCGFYGVAYLK